MCAWRWGEAPRHGLGPIACQIWNVQLAMREAKGWRARHTEDRGHPRSRTEGDQSLADSAAAPIPFSVALRILVSVPAFSVL